jgi:hypothetical protein
MGGGANPFQGMCTMENDVAKPDEEILTVDVPDEALERAAGVTNGQGMTVGICTHWYQCGWPQ